MKKLFLFFFSLGFFTPLWAQDDDRTLLRGTVLYRNSPVPNENVINTTAQQATITNERGEFTIPVKPGDDVVFMALNYQLEMVKITPEILQNNRLVVEVTEKVTELDEVVVSPEEQEEFIRLRNEDFKEYVYETDPTTEVVNIAEDPTVRGMQYGLNFVNIFKLLAKTIGGEKEAEGPAPLKASEVLRQVYDDRFFVSDLQIPQDQIDAFLVYCDTQLPPRALLRKENEFQLIDFLVTQSEAFRKIRQE
ncbi:carboxypeptidase-like regulatory domain-containing protein [Robiginitalea marina]|uniref:Carboxypeptidase-like regulatory domain-containing protein n=1 Tax=Robiginitalea marina TaxID=2954105 RepID=A0ABT1AY15_9FLAO|nr:carboxypeptidase-like regulatory domain-containing protein [Robiginitalea marina]MCO5724824.1 carboxypeptidase-like regulatory domain-containing protein [Robiginitalea marina]